MRIRAGWIAWGLAIATLPAMAQSGVALRSTLILSDRVVEPSSPFAPADPALGKAKPILLAQAASEPATWAAPAAPVAVPRFEIRRYLTQGNSLLSQERLNQVLQPFTGKDKDFGDVQRALEALQAAYQAEGYGGVEIRLPEQELERGEVRFVVIEVKIAKITVEGNVNFDEANIRRSVPSLREGATPNSREIAESIRLANENPAKQSAVLLRGSQREDEIDRKSTRLNSSHCLVSRMPSSA